MENLVLESKFQSNSLEKVGDITFPGLIKYDENCDTSEAVFPSFRYSDKIYTRFVVGKCHNRKILSNRLVSIFACPFADT